MSTLRSNRAGTTVADITATHSVLRKIRGAIRSAASMEWWGNLFTCVMTWRMRKMDVYEELAKCV